MTKLYALYITAADTLICLEMGSVQEAQQHATDCCLILAKLIHGKEVSRE